MPRETTRIANKGPQARYIMFSRTHKKTGLRNSNDIMFAPLFSRRKEAVDQERKEVGEMRERGPAALEEEKRSQGLKGGTA